MGDVTRTCLLCEVVCFFTPVAYLLDEAVTCERPFASLAMTCTSDLALNALSVFQNVHILQVLAKWN